MMKQALAWQLANIKPSVQDLKLQGVKNGKK
jgi:hypothetical protein